MNWRIFNQIFGENTTHFVASFGCKTQKLRWKLQHFDVKSSLMAKSIFPIKTQVFSQNSTIFLPKFSICFFKTHATGGSHGLHHMSPLKNLLKKLYLLEVLKNLAGWRKLRLSSVILHSSTQIWFRRFFLSFLTYLLYLTKLKKGFAFAFTFV